MQSQPASSSTTHDEPAPVHGPSSPPPPLTRTSRWVAIVLALAGLGAVGVGIAQRVVIEGKRSEERDAIVAEQRARAAAPAEVPVTAPVPFRFEPEYPITGTLTPLEEADLSFNAGGRLRTVDVELGERVRAGQVLATLDRRSVVAQAAFAAASEQASEASLQLAEDRLRRAESLHAQGATSDADLLAAQQQVAIARAQHAQATAQQRITSTSGSDHILRAPFDGTVTQVPAGIGAVVMPGQTLFRVENLSSLILRTGITEKAVPGIRVGDGVELDGLPEHGEVRALAPSLDPITRRAPVEITVPNPDGSLVGHVLVQATIRPGRSVPAFLVPPTSLREDQTVLVVGAEDTIEVRPVRSQIARDGRGIVLSGLAQNDRVVIRPTPDLTPGRRVQPMTASAEGT